MSADYILGFYNCQDRLSNYLNSLDTEEMTVKELRSEIIKWTLLERPYGKQ